MTTAYLWEIHQRARDAYLAEPSAERLTAALSTFADFLAMFLDDDVAARAETERLRANLERARVLA